MDINEFKTYIVREVSNIEDFTKFSIDFMAEPSNLDTLFGEDGYCYGELIPGGNQTIKPRCELFGAAADVNKEMLTLFYTYFGTGLTISAEDYKKACNYMQNYYRQAIKESADQLEPSRLDYELIRFIRTNHDAFTTIRCVVLSDSVISTGVKEPNTRIESKLVQFEAWDVNFLWRHFSKGSDHQIIDVDLTNTCEKSYDVPYLYSPSEGYDCYLAILPGQMLHDVYETYSSNLMHNNVRYYLGENNVNNKGQLVTIRENPTNFLAFNNGITAFAESVEVKDNKLIKIHDFRILNGGQTTANIFTAGTENKNKRGKTLSQAADLSKVFVQMKLIVLPENGDENLLNLVALYSNSQTKVQKSDYSVLNPFNIGLQELSRTVSVPKLCVKWYYARVLRQYEIDCDNAKRNGTLVNFQAMYPKQNVFDKLLVSKVYEAWIGMPHVACLGNQKCYTTFIDQKGKQKPDKIFYEDIVGLLLLYKYMKQESETYFQYHTVKQFIINYALAMIHLWTNDKLSLYKIWLAQGLTPELKAYVDRVGELVNNWFVANLPSGLDIRSWSQKEEVWKQIIKTCSPIELPQLSTSLKADYEDERRKQESEQTITKEDHEQIMSMGSRYWDGLAEYGGQHTESFGPDDINSLRNIASCLRLHKLLGNLDIICAKKKMNLLGAITDADAIRAMSLSEDDCYFNDSYELHQRLVNYLSLSDTDRMTVIQLVKIKSGEDTAKWFAKRSVKKNITEEDKRFIVEQLDIVNSAFKKNY